MTETTRKELHRIARRYQRQGITPEQLMSIAATAPEGVSERAAIVGIRAMLGKEYGETEYFTPAEVAEVTGESESDVIARLQIMGVDAFQITCMIPGLFGTEGTE